MRISVVAAALVSGIAVLSLSTAAEGGGPTSVLVTNPATGEAAATYYTDARYAELERLLHTNDTPARPPADRPTATYFNVTWLVHDVSPWRLDQVYLDVPGGPWVATSMVFAEGDEQRVSWRHVSEGKALVALLDDLGVTGTSSPVKPPVGLPDAGTSDQPFADPREPSLQPPAAEPSTPGTTWFSLTGWRWLVPGLVLGLGVGVLAARRVGPVELRQVLVDREQDKASAL